MCSGSFGMLTKGGLVLRCGGCGVVRLDEKVSIASSSYENDEYCFAMAQGPEIEDFFKHANPTQIYNLSAFWTLDLLTKLRADIGCVSDMKNS